MKILVITPIFPPDIGGPASYVPAVSASLVEKGHAVTVLTLSVQPPEGVTVTVSPELAVGIGVITKLLPYAADAGCAANVIVCAAAATVKP